MSTEYWIAIIIAVVALVAVIVVGLVAYKQVQPTIENSQDTQKKIQGEMDRFTKQANVIQEKVDHINERVNGIQTEAEEKMADFDDLKQRANELQGALTVLKDNGPEYSKGIAQNTFEELKEDGPQLAETFKRAFKRTYSKQKARYGKE